MSSSLPKGFTLRTQGASTFLEIDLSHFDGEGIAQFAKAVADIRGYSVKPRREAWKGKKQPRPQYTGKSQHRRQ